ncbi:Nicotinate-nucleotide--dimethylbenzimidazole phosphoribosyltransferase [bacterium HR19]|nr:Nicotinate-nucleotide--dimethylbenzimidazole phosphoribosyltransferase [bacterium HR19]
MNGTTSIEKAVRDKLDNLTKPKGSLGFLEEIVVKYAKITGKTEFHLPLKKMVFVFCGDHGVAEEGVSAYPQEVTAQMVYNFIKGGAGINVISRYVGAEVYVVDVGVKEDILSQSENFIMRKISYGTRNFTKEPAMTEEQAQKSIEVGIEMSELAQSKRADIVIPGDMGIANTTPSSAIISFVTEQPPEKVVGRGTGIDDTRLRKKIEVVKRAIEMWKPKDGFDALCKFGGFEIGAIAGLILGCKKNKIPVVLDGLITLAGFLIAYSIDPEVKDYVFAGHKTAEPGGNVALSFLGIRPILDLDMRLGEGTGGTLATSIIECALKIYNEMATFSSAGVSQSNI